MTHETNHGSETDVTANSACETNADLLPALAAWFSASGATAYLVGGAVRDRFLGRETPDLDFAVAGSAQELARRLAEEWQGVAVELDAARDTARVVLVKRPDRAEIDLKSFSGTIEDDLWDRDLTINALALSSADAAGADWRRKVIDPTGGRRDLERRVIRWTSPTAPRRDPLRMLRALRLAATLGFAASPETEKLIGELAPLLSRVSPERSRDELFAMLGSPRAGDALERCARLGLLDALWTPPAQSPSLVRPEWRRGVDWVRRVERLLGAPGNESLPVARREALEAWLAQEAAGGRNCGQLLRWFALFAGALAECDDVDGLAAACRAFRMSRSERAAARGVDEWRATRDESLAGDPLRGAARLRFFRRAGKAAPFCLLLAAARTPPLSPQVAELLDNYFAQDPTAKPDALVDGRRLRRELGVASGRRLGELLRLLEDAHADGVVHTAAEAVEFARRALRSLEATTPGTREGGKGGNEWR